MKRPRGFVLAAVLFALVLLGALTAAGFFAALQELRAGSNAQNAVRVRTAAESALWYALATWDAATLDSLAVGAWSPAPGPPFAGLSIATSLRRLSDRLYLARSLVQGPGGSEAAAQTVVRLIVPEYTAALRVRALGAGLGGVATGDGQTPAGWACSAEDTITALTIQSGATDSAFFRFGALDWGSVTAWVVAVPGGGDSLGVHYAPGDLVISGGYETGLLVVDGDLTLRNSARIVGLVLVHGSLVLDGGGGVVSGAVVASQVVAINGYTPVQPAVVFSSCAAQRAARSRALAGPVPGLNPAGFY